MIQVNISICIIFYSHKIPNIAFLHIEHIDMLREFIHTVDKKKNLYLSNK